jgi:hypothetical protein
VEAINEDVFDLDDLEEDELLVEEAADSAPASFVSSAFYSAVKEVG